MSAPPDPAETARDLRLAVGGLVRAVRDRDAVSTPQLAVLGFLGRDGPATRSELAARTGVRPQSLAATARGLLDAGWIAAGTHPTDGRKAPLELTDAGRRVLEGSRAVREDHLSRAIADELTPAEHETVAAATALLLRLAGGVRG